MGVNHFFGISRLRHQRHRGIHLHMCILLCSGLPRGRMLAPKGHRYLME